MHVVQPACAKKLTSIRFGANLLNGNEKLANLIIVQSWSLEIIQM